MGCSFQHGCLHACTYDKSWGVSECTEPTLQDITLQILLTHSSEDHLSLVLHMACHKGFLMSLSPLLSQSVLPALIKLSTCRKQSMKPLLKWLLQRAYICHSSLGSSQQTFNPWLSTSTSKETEFLHPHHTYRLRDSPKSAARHCMACPDPWFRLMKPSPDLEPQTRDQVSW